MAAKNMKIGNVPNLRFPGFEGEWEDKKLGEIAVIGRGKSKHRPRDAEFLFGGKYPFIQTGDIRKADLYLTKFTQTYSEAGLNQSKLWDENTLCITIAANIAETAVLKIKACFPDSVIGLIPKEDQAIVLFVKHLFDKFKVEIQNLSQGAAQDNLNQEKLSKIQFSFPSIVEQRKIASFLSIIDERITTQSKIIERLKTLINELREQLFAKKLKFKNNNGDVFLAWTSEKLGGVTFKVDKKNKQREQLPIYSVSNINGFVPQSEQFDNIDSNDRGYDISLYKIVEAQTFVYNPARINVGSIAYSGDLNKTIVSSLYVCFKTASSLDDNFFKQFLQTEYFKNEVLKKGEGGVRIYLFYENFAQITISLPCYEEQIGVANFLSSLTEKINLEKLILKKYENQKKYLLASLFI